MPDYELANSLAAEAFSLWGSGQLEASVDRYSRVIAMVPEYPDWHSQYACVLQEMGRHEEATSEYEAALELVLEQTDSEADPSVKIARYFLADHLTKYGAAARALDVLAPAVRAIPDNWLIGAAQARALYAVGRCTEARAAAERAIANAGSESKRADLTKSLRAVLEAPNG